MSNTDVQLKIRKIVQQFVRDRREPQPFENLFESGLLDSFSLPEIVSALEDAFGIRIPDSELNPRHFESLERIETYVAARL